MRPGQRTRRDELFDFVLDLAERRKGSLPTRHTIWRLARESGFTLNWTTFKYHMNRLQSEGRVLYDYELCVLYIPQSVWEYRATRQMEFSLD